MRLDPLVWLALVGCQRPGPGDDVDPTETDAADTDAADTDVSDTDTVPDERAPLRFGVVEEQPAICFGTSYPCGALTDDDVRRAALASAAPGLTVRWGGFETERSGFGLPGNAARRSADSVATAGGQLEPAWLIERAQATGYADGILAVPVSRSDAAIGHGEWTAGDVGAGLDAWKAAVEASGFPPPAVIELGNEPWNRAEPEPDGFRQDPEGYVAKAGPIGEVVRQRILDWGWPTRIAVVADNWPGTGFEGSGAVAFPQTTLDLADAVAVNGPPMLQTHGYPLHGGWWCPKAGSTTDASDVACVYALYTMLRALRERAPDAELILTEDNYDATAQPEAGVYATLAALLTYSAGGVAYTWFGNNDYDNDGSRYELFVGTEPAPIVDDLAAIQRLIAGRHAGDVVVVEVSGEIAVASGGYTMLVNADTAPPPYGTNGTAPTRYVFDVGGGRVEVDLSTMTVTGLPP